MTKDDLQLYYKFSGCGLFIVGSGAYNILIQSVYVCMLKQLSVVLP
jgi:hypothetical protein